MDLLCCFDRKFRGLGESKCVLTVLGVKCREKSWAPIDGLMDWVLCRIEVSREIEVFDLTASIVHLIYGTPFAT